MSKQSFIFIFIIVLINSLVADIGLAKITPDKKGTYEVVLERLKERQKKYVQEKKQLNEKILKLEGMQARLEARKDKKYSQEDFENEIISLVVSLADVQNKFDLIERQIKEQETRKDQIEFAIEVESFLSEGVKRPPKTIPRAREQEVIRRIPEKEEATVLEKIEYEIATNDELQITVYGEPDLGKTVRVSADGSISYPLLGRIKVGGLTAGGLEEKLAKLLSDGGYIMNPQVSVYIEKFSPISVLGEVRNPGSYELKGRLSVMDAIAQAGGFNIDADINNVKILRMADGQQKTIQVRLEDIKKGIETVEIILKPNDAIFVEKIGRIVVLGEVARPGTFELKDKITLLEAIAMAGGFTDIAAVDGTRIIREDIGSKRKIIRVRITDITYRGKKTKDVELLSGDIVYVPETLF